MMIVASSQRNVREGRGAGPSGVAAAHAQARQVQTPFDHLEPIYYTHIIYFCCMCPINMNPKDLTRPT
jgi:hypothetical protein